jgi:DNA-binding NarL/FixJ family response regulator
VRKIKVLLVDDHAVLRAGLGALLSGEPDMEVVGDASNGADALVEIARHKPDVAVVDITMPGMSGIELIGRIRKEHPETRALALTMHDDAAYARAVLAAGGSGHVVKDADASILLGAIRAVYRGRTFVELGEKGSADREAPELLTWSGGAARRRGELLSPREWQILELLAQGHTNREISERLPVSVKTVETYRARIVNKLGLRSRAELVRFALELGLLAPGQRL